MFYLLPLLSSALSFPLLPSLPLSSPILSTQHARVDLTWLTCRSIRLLDGKSSCSQCKVHRGRKARSSGDAPLLCHIILWHVMLCYVMLCYVMLCLLCYVMLCYVMLCYVMLYHIILCHVILYYVMLCHVMLCHVMLCHVILCYVMLEQCDEDDGYRTLGTKHSRSCKIVTWYGGVS